MMNIDQAKQIPLRTIIENFGGKFSHQRKEDEAWYHSPFRPNERTASFKVNVSRNTWKDFGNGQGGSTLDLWLDYNNADRKNRQAISNALKALSGFGNQSIVASFQVNKFDYKQPAKPIVPKSRFQLTKSPTRIFHDSLKQEVGRRCLSLATVGPYLKQAYIKDTETKKTYYGFAFQNNLDGWEISIPNLHKEENFKTCVGSKASTFIKGENESRVDVFEGFWDFLTWLRMNKREVPKHSSYVMNSLSFKSQIIETIIDNKNRIQNVFLFLDNDKAGVETMEIMLSALEPNELKIGSMNHLYEGKKDLSEYWIKYHLHI